MLKGTAAMTMQENKFFLSDMYIEWYSTVFVHTVEHKILKIGHVEIVVGSLCILI